MDKELKEWLQFRWIRDNHKRYRNLFEEWVCNITQNQINGFRKCMFYDKERVLMR